ncbi:MAG: GIY-YIG nuclease family protein [Solirubrobacterales bacterium]
MLETNPYIVYIVRCSDGTLYTGVTNDLDDRIRKHNQGRGARYTRGRAPVTLLYTESVPGKSEALKREYEIKRLPRSQKLALIQGSG